MLRVTDQQNDFCQTKIFLNVIFFIYLDTSMFTFNSTLFILCNTRVSASKPITVFYGRIVEQFMHLCFKSVHTAKLSCTPERWVSPAKLRCWHTHNQTVQAKVLMLHTLNESKRSILILYEWHDCVEHISIKIVLCRILDCARKHNKKNIEIQFFKINVCLEAFFLRTDLNDWIMTDELHWAVFPFHSIAV